MQTTTFNIGWMCKNCGPVQESKKRSIAKVQRDCCKECDSPVVKWSRPLNERAGRCRNCANTSFKSKIHLSVFMRECKACGEIMNPDNGEILTPGRK